MKRIFCIICMLALLAWCLCACDGTAAVGDGDSQAVSEAPSSQPAAAGDTEQAITLSADGFDLTVSDRDLDGSYEAAAATAIVFSAAGAEISGSGASAQGAVVTISQAGVYLLSGACSQGQLRVEAGDSDKVQLVLNGLELTSSTCPLLLLSADKVFLTLAPASVNSLTDGADYTLTEDDSTVDAAVFSKADLTINGSGSLTVSGQYKHGIVSKDDLVITGGQLTVTAASTALEGKDCLKLIDGSLVLNAGSDGMRSTNEEDSDRGFVYIAGGTVEITCGSDGIQAVTLLDIAGGDIHIASGDDAIHSDDALWVEDGQITVSASYEGLEACQILISGGVIQVTASDDGLNAAGGNDQSGMAGPFGGGWDSFAADSSKLIRISGGYILVDAGGDGIDSNGNLEISGGVVLVSGPTDNGNGALDYAGTAVISGGRFLAVGSSGMAQSFSSDSTQGTIMVNVDTQAAGTPIALLDEAGQVLISFTPAKAYQNVVVSTPEIAAGGVYTLSSGTAAQADAWGYASGGSLSAGSELASVTMDSLHYSAGGGMGGMGQPGGMGGGKGGRGDMGDGTTPPEWPDGTAPDGTTPPEWPEGATPPDMGDGTTRPQRPQDGTLPDGSQPGQDTGESI